jgi:alpha-galactosidase
MQLGVTDSLAIESTTALTVEDAPTGIESAEVPAAVAPELLDRMDGFSLRPHHLRLRQVHLVDQTDFRNELVHEREDLLHICERITAQGNLFILEDSLTGAGLILLKEAPLPHARPLACACDLTIAQVTQLALTGHGIGGGVTDGYQLTLLVFTGGRAGCTAALQRYQRQVRPYLPGRDGRFLSNTWGDRSQDARVNEPFMLGEAEVGAELGVDVVQIDDGWQAGRTSNSVQRGGVWEGFWGADANFWAPHPTRFPHGLEPVVARAQAAGMQYGLWFAPDSADDFANWARDAEAILHLHRTYGVNYIKIDGVKARTRLSEIHLRRFFDKVLEESLGAVVFDLDITAEIRPGYFGLMHAGPLFVENRYTDWGRYWPHHTLRNLWTLTHYIDPTRLRMEFLNNARHPEKYGDDPLAPIRYTPDYLFASIMIANPLGWFEISGLSADYRAAVAPLVQVWKAHRDALHGGRIYPIGTAPDGTSWTGFLSVTDEGEAGYLLLFREFTAQAECNLELPAFSMGNYRCELLAGAGTAEVRDGRVTARIPERLSYLFLRVSPGSADVPSAPCG